MKVFFPRNISGGWFNLSIQIGPVQVSLVQLMLLAVGVGLTLAIANGLIRNGVGKAVAFLIALPMFIVLAIIAFFKYSELRLHEFIAKQIKTHFLDVTEKFQINYDRPDDVSIALAKARRTDHDVVITQKDLVLDKAKLERLDVL